MVISVENPPESIITQGQESKVLIITGWLLFVSVIFHNRFQTFSFSGESTLARAISYNPVLEWRL